MDEGTGWRGCRHQSGRAQRELPLYRREPPRDHGIARAIDAGCWGSHRSVRIGRRESGLQASSATIYAHRYDAANDEQTGTGIIPGDEPNEPDTWRFSLDVVKSWEKALGEAETPQTRKVALRTSMLMSPDRGGIFDVLVWLVRRRLGGWVGDGRQFVSWIHDRDYIAAVEFLIDRDLSGPVNLAAPEPLPNADFMHSLRQAWGTRIGLPANRWMLEIGTWLLRTESELVLKRAARRAGPAVEDRLHLPVPNLARGRSRSVPPLARRAIPFESVVIHLAPAPFPGKSTDPAVLTKPDVRLTWQSQYARKKPHPAQERFRVYQPHARPSCRRGNGPDRLTRQRTTEGQAGRPRPAERGDGDAGQA